MKDDPGIETRTAQEFVDEIRTDRIPLELPKWLRGAGRKWPDGDPGAALVEIFARFMTIVSDRLNRVPEKSFLAFLEMIGVGLRTPKAARVPVRFILSKGTTQGVVVPKRTPLATTDTPPLNFETEKALMATPAQLVKVVTYDRAADHYAIHEGAMEPGGNLFPIFACAPSALIEREIYFAQERLFKTTKPTRLTVEFTVDGAAQDALPFFNGLTWVVGAKPNQQPVSEAPVVTRPQASVVRLRFRNFISNTTATVLDETLRWLWAHTKIPLSDPAITIPTIKSIFGWSRLNHTTLPDAAFGNDTKFDVNKRGFFPFSDRPKQGDAFYIASDEVFSRKGAWNFLLADLSFPIKPDPDAIPAPTLEWEFWNGERWIRFSNSQDGYEFDDNTQSFTSGGVISFICPDNQPTEWNGVLAYWFRVRIVGGSFGQDGRMVEKNSPPLTIQDWTYEPPSWRPPFVTSLRVVYSYVKKRPLPVDNIAVYSDFEYRRIQSPGTTLTPFKPFVAPAPEDPALYMAFDRPPANVPINLYLAVQEQQQPPADPTVVWEYCSGETGNVLIWQSLGAQDETRNLTQPGIVQFIGPVNLSQQRLLGIQPLYWLRARLVKGEKERFSLSGVIPNTVWAVNAVTLLNEVFGSSNAAPGQTFKLTRPPVLEGEQIEVRELESPPPEDIEILEQEGETNPVKPIKGTTGKIEEIWVRWHGVENFFLSGPKSRHYVLDRVRGTIRFGDGINGMIAPPGRDNLRAAFYQSGGGRKGNVPAYSITVLKRAVPHVDRVENFVAASGGSNEESLEEVKTRGPLTLKHRNRAVSLEDYEWLARESSLQVARASCIPATDATNAGSVKLIIVPDSEDPEPLPSPGLINVVKDYINARRIPTASLEFIAPTYQKIGVTTTVVPKSFDEAEAVRGRIRSELTAFLHPLKGGPDKQGWAFGRDAYLSEFAAVIEGIEGVDHIKTLAINGGDLVSIDKSTLASNGVHSITMSSA